jgi:GTP-binding protein
MVIKGQSNYLGCTDTLSFIPAHPLSELCFSGASNVGKSSLINALLGRNGLARTSKTPGCTQKIHFYEWAEKLVITDLPGYGYAKTSKTMQAEWQKLMDYYLGSRDQLRMVFALLDARHAPKKTDIAFLDYLNHIQRPFIPVLTKADKISDKRKKELLRDLESMHKNYVGCFPLAIFTSSVKRGGIEALNFMCEWLITNQLDMPQNHPFVQKSKDIAIIG